MCTLLLYLENSKPSLEDAKDSEKLSADLSRSSSNVASYIKDIEKTELKGKYVNSARIVLTSYCFFVLFALLLYYSYYLFVPIYLKNSIDDNKINTTLFFVVNYILRW